MLTPLQKFPFLPLYYSHYLKYDLYSDSINIPVLVDWTCHAGLKLDLWPPEALCADTEFGEIPKLILCAAKIETLKGLYLGWLKCTSLPSTHWRAFALRAPMINCTRGSGWVLAWEVFWVVTNHLSPIRCSQNMFCGIHKHLFCVNSRSHTFFHRFKPF